MSIFASPSEARLRSLGIEPVLPCPPLPNIVSEWAALLPLVCHLAGQRDDYITTGEVALMGRLSVGIFPRLGTLSGLARLLDRGTKYLDHASTRGGSSRTVWDVKWGSVFPCANGAALSAISRYLLSRDGKPAQRMPETMPPFHDDDEKSPQNDFKIRPVHSSFGGGVRYATSKEKKTDGEGIRRYQVLHVYQLYRKESRTSLRQQITKLRLSLPGQIVCFLGLFCLAVVFSLLGSFGTVAVIICSSVSELVAMSITVSRPSTYLRNNETHYACMLVASHENATEWHLYIGDRAAADTLLNKPMFVVPKCKLTHLAASWFWFANLLQIAAMTFVAAQKGWDGVWMVVLLATHWALRWSSSGRCLAREWMEREGIDVEVKSFEFGGRYAMMGAIQLLGGSTATRWMDNILVPHPRREAWLKVLKGEGAVGSLDKHDERWLEYTSEASFASAEVLKAEFGVGESESSV